MTSSQPVRKQAHKQVTPPSSFVVTPPSPPLTDEKASPRAARILQIFEHIQAGKRYTYGPWTSFPLKLQEYDELLRLIRNDKDDCLSSFVRDKIRYDYDGRNECLTIRMATEVHEIFLEHVKLAIMGQLRDIAKESGDVAEFARKVVCAGSSRLALPAGNSKSMRCPDANFRHPSARKPAVIIEVAYTQKRKSLASLVDDYLLDLNRNVQVVVALDIQYQGSEEGKATVSMWRLGEYPAPDGKNILKSDLVADEVEFRKPSGEVANSDGLRLCLKDFAIEPQWQHRLEKDNRDIIVSAEMLCQFLQEAESWDEDHEDQEARFEAELRPDDQKKRAREPTPSYDEKLANKRRALEKKDDDYVQGSSEDYSES
ncbi:hypothetical protein H2201_009178 [Coniosporium apollinis]|uniref:HNH nuclease domain-containing protein n=1 Tax=Coniosporium apollinis TaxID=61459 RepID=A0ABQ9NEJ4_9PEZI|nr:hypothetical protein H2201_009178 [Coniosporium apollinis]